MKKISIKLKKKNPLEIKKSKKPINKKSKTVKKKKDIKKVSKPINKKKKENNKYLKEIMEKRFNVIIFIMALVYILIGARLFDLQILKDEEYSEKLAMSTEKKIESTSAPRGRIYDRNYNLLVDNEGVKTIYYKKQNDITTKDEIEIAYMVAENIDVDYSKIDDNK